MHIRAATSADIAAMHRIRLSVLENRLSPGTAIDESSYISFLTASVVAESEGALVGFGALDLARGSVWALFVSRSAEGRGIGRALHLALLDLAAAHGLRRLSLTTAPGTRADRFYRRSGWQAKALTAGGEVQFERAVPASC